MTTKYLTKYNITYLKQIEADVQIANMTEDQVQTEINEVRNINLTGNENEESSSYIKNWNVSNSVVDEDESNKIRDEYSSDISPIALQENISPISPSYPDRKWQHSTHNIRANTDHTMTVKLQISQYILSLVI